MKKIVFLFLLHSSLASAQTLYQRNKEIMDSMRKVTDSTVALRTAINSVSGGLSPTGNGSQLTGLTKSQVGLGNVDNTSDANKPISSLTQTALDGKQASGSYATGTGTATNTNTGDNAANSTYASDYRAANFVVGTNYLAPSGNGSALTGITENQITNLVNDLSAKQATITTGTTAQYFKGDLSLGTFPTTTAGFSNSTNKNFVTDAQQTIINNTSGTNTGDQFNIGGNAVTASQFITPRNINGVSFNGTANINVPAYLSATIDAVTQAANISTATLYAVPATGLYRVTVYIAISQAATTSSTMPSTTITYTDGINSTVHSTTTTATAATNSLSTSFAQTTYICYAKTGTNIQYATGSYASSGAQIMNYHLHIRVEAL